MRSVRKWILFGVVFVLCFGVLPAALADYSYYTVARGDTLYKIAGRVRSSVNELVMLNGIANPDRIEAGQVLLVPAATTTSGLTYDGQYVVVRGDTLRKIAKRFGTTVEAIADLNGIGDPDQIRAGQRLWIQPGTSDVGRVIDNYYVVKRGDTLYGIARRYGLSMEDLAEINGLDDPNWIVVGQRLRLG